MAHNNGMVPRSRKGRGVWDNAAKFQAAVQAAPSIASDPQMDPAYLATPVSELTDAQTAAFVPHRPARPEKSEGGKKFKLVSEYEPAGDQPTAIVELVKGGGLFRGGRIRWVAQYVDAKNYLLFELDRHTFWAEVMEKGKKFERQKTPHQLDTQKSFTIQIEITPEHIVHKVKTADGGWLTLDTFAEPGRSFTAGKFGFLIQGSDEIGISDFSFTPK